MRRVIQYASTATFLMAVCFFIVDLAFALLAPAERGGNLYYTAQIGTALLLIILICKRVVVIHH